MLITSARLIAPTIRRADDARPNTRRRILRLVSVKYPRPMHHATKVMTVEGMPVSGWSARVLFLRKPDGTIEAYAPLILYMKQYWSRSSTWQDSVVRGIGLLWDHLQAHASMASPSVDEPWRSDSFAAFARDLLTGTIEHGIDRLGLFWPGLPYGRALLLLRAIEDFLAWFQHQCRDCEAMAGKAMVAINRPDTSLSYSELLIWSRVRQLSMLKHLKLPEKIKRTESFDIGRKPSGSDVDPVKHFPTAYATKLILEGHRRPTRRGDYAWNFRDQLIALLCQYGGLRRSEPLHLYWSDVTLDPDPQRHGCALVALHHPAESDITFEDALGCTVTAKRKEYLRQMFDLSPRHMVQRGRYHAGWKGMKLGKKLRSVVFWSDVEAGRAFYRIYTLYMRDIRPEIMKRRLDNGGQDHPFLFVSDGLSNHAGCDARIGDPYSAKAYERNHRAAVLRLGLAYGKDAGTATHSLRHYYCQSLMDLRLPAPAIQEAVHHNNPQSQIVYTERGAAKLSNMLNDAKHGRLEPLRDFESLGSESSIALRNLRK